jgi:hypothetical protein
MSLGRIPNVASLRAQADAASSSSAIPLKLSEMDLANRQAYFSAYGMGAARHGSLRTFSAPTAAVRAGASASNSTTMTGETAEKIVGRLLLDVLLGLAKYSLVAFFLWCTVVFVPWRQLGQVLGEWLGAILQEIAPQLRDGFAGLLDLFVLLFRHIIHDITHHHWVIQARQATRERLIQTRQHFDHVIVNFRHHWLFATIYLHYQRVIIWIGRHKLHMIVFLVFVNLISTMVESQLNKSSEVFLKWTELQRYIEDPIPEYVFRQPKKDGSSSHYRREADWLHVSDDTVPRLAESIPAPLTTTMPVQEDTALLSGAFAEETRQMLPGEQVEFCRHCRQEHCCEVYY